MKKRLVCVGVLFVICLLIFGLTFGACLTEFNSILNSPYSEEVGAGMCLVLCWFFGFFSLGLFSDLVYYSFEE